MSSLKNQQVKVYCDSNYYYYYGMIKYENIDRDKFFIGIFDDIKMTQFYVLFNFK